MRLSRSFSARLSTIILLITSILFTAAILVVSYFSHKLIADEAVKNATNILHATTLDIDETLGGVESSVNNMRWVVTEHLNDTTYLYHITSEIVSSNEEIVGSAIAFRSNFFADKHFFSPYSYDTTDGNNIISKQLGNDHYDYFGMEWFEVPYRTKKAYWSTPYYDESGGEIMMVTYSYPLLDEQGEVFAVITADISLKWLTDKINSLHPYKNSFTILQCHNSIYINAEQPVMVNYNNYGNEKDKRFEESRKALEQHMMNGELGTMRIKDKNGRSFAVYGPLHNGWSTAIVSPFKDVFLHLSRMTIIIVIVSAMGLLLLFVFCMHIVRKLTRPITEFSVAALNMAKGNFHAKIPKVHTKDEMLQLYNSFDYMQKSITRYISELRNTTAENERLESELSIARKIQMSMVPTHFPDNEKYAVHAILQPAREVGGDFYDYLVRDNELYFAIGDVSGKGVPAALVMAITRTAFQFLSGINLPIDKMTDKINSTLSQHNDNLMFVTLFTGKIDLETGDMYYCNAGHNPIIICHTDGHAQYLHAKSNIAIGVFDEYKYELEHIKLEKGSRLILYTDGITEAEDSQKAQFGEQRLLNFASNLSADISTENLVNKLMETIKDFTKEAEQNDDITLLTISLK